MNDSAKNTLDTIMSYPFVQWAIQHWLLLLIIVIVSLILIFFVIIPLLVRLFRKGKKSVETSELKKDLMIWKNLSQLVQGGDSTQNVKKNLSAQLKTIRLLLEQGIALIKKKSKRKYDIPWFAVLGEPQSGKSSMLKNSGLDLICASGHNDNFAQQIPLSCWLGTRAFFLDVSGKIFFDRWIESSGAEWDYLLKLINKFHGKCPLSGIILAIPADALLADDEILTKQKAQLIGAEMYQLLHTLGMNLPCHVIITKMDMLLGFREYFATLSEENKSSVFGWYNPNEKGEYSKVNFDEYWTSTEDYLREGVYPLVLNPVFYNNNNNNNNSSTRFSTTSKIYLFPESFSKLKDNLDIYLNSIFGPDAWNGRDQIFMTGVFFSSAEDNGIVLSDTFANLQGKKQEEVPLRSHPIRSNVAFFVKQFLTNVVIPGKVLASFTAGKLLKKQIPAFILGFLILFLGIFWMFRALIENHELQDKFDADVKYYQNLGNMLESNEISHSPLVGTDEKGNPVFFNEIPMKSMPNISRLQFFYNTYAIASKDFYAPWGYKMSSFLCFGWPLNMGYQYRQTIFNLIQSEMVFIPTVRTVQAKILAKEPQPFSITKRDAIEDFSDIMLSLGKENSSFTPINDLLMYIFPDIHIDTLQLFSTYNEKYQKGNDGVKARIIYDYDYAKAQRTGYKQFFNAWSSLNIYEEMDYPIVRSGYRCLTTLNKKQEILRQKIDNLSRNPLDSENDLISIQKDLKGQVQLIQEGREINKKLSAKKITFWENTSEKSSIAVAPQNKADAAVPAGSFSPLDMSFEKYKEVLKNDHKYILKYIQRLSEVVKRRSDFFQIKEESANVYFKEIEENLQSEFDLLKQQEQYIIKSRMMHIAKTKEQDKKEIEIVSDEKLCVFEVLDQLTQIVLQLPDAGKLASVYDFQARWDDLFDKSSAALEEFDAVAQKYAEDPDVTVNAKALRKYLVHQIAYNKFMLAANLVDCFPLKHSDWNLWISKFEKNDEDIFKIPQNIANESIGSLSVPIHARPDILIPLMTPFSMVKRFAVPAKTEGTEAAPNTPPQTVKIKNFEQAEQCLQHGLSDYIDFWGTYPDSISLKCETWSEFRTACAKLKPYEVNTLLLVVYKTAVNVLQQIPDNLLRDDLKKARKAYIEAMNGKIQLITPHFSEICSQQTSAWSLLPDKPDDAYKEFISYNQKKLMSEYLAVVATGNKGDIPWWSLFFKHGIELLKKSAVKSLAESIAKDENNFFRFPICADAVSKEVFGEDDIAKLAKTLSMMGFSSTNAEKDITGSAEKDAKDDANASSAEDFISEAKKLDLSTAMDPQSKKCGEIIYLVADALGMRNKLLVWTLSIPEIEKQKLLSVNSGNLPLAQYRYRFLEVYSNGLSKTKRVPLSEKALAELARGDVYEKNLELRFYAYSTSQEPTAIVKFDGEWSILRMYLLPNSYFDPETKTLYAPIEIKDNADAKTVLHLGIKFNKVLPPPAEWPSSKNWPTFSRVQRKAQPSNVSQEELWKLLLNAPNPESREQLLVRYVVNGPYPEIDVCVDDNIQIQQTKTGVSYRYIELSVPGQPSKKINLEKGAVLGNLPLLVPGFSVKFYRFSEGKNHDAELQISGPYAVLNLLSDKGGKITGNDFQVCIGDQKVLLPLKLKLKKTK